MQFILSTMKVRGKVLTHLQRHIKKTRQEYQVLRLSNL
jgi:hypothetical protein